MTEFFNLPVVGWRECLDLPELGIKSIKVKVDTGAKTSALHAFSIHPFYENGEQWVHFKVHPYPKDRHTTIITQARLIDHRTIRSSVGHEQLRPVIQTMVNLGTESWPIQITLTNRDVMGYRMLLGRQAIENRFLVHPSRSFLQSKNLSFNH